MIAVRSVISDAQAIGIATLCFALAGCGGESAEAPVTTSALAASAQDAGAAPGGAQAVPPESTAQPFIRRALAPSAIDESATQSANKHTGKPNEHLVLLPTAPAARVGELFLFIGGTNHFPTGTEAILRAGARRGSHAIALAYSNYEAVGRLCLASTDEDCTAKVREEIITGEEESPLIEVAEPDGIVVRLTKLLRRLRDDYPGEGWDRFLTADAIDWSRISVAGHSQGAGHAALLAKREVLRRAVMMSGVADLGPLGGPARWLSRENKTPVARQYGFSHVADPVVPIVIAEASWDAIGLDVFGPSRSVDGGSPPYNGSHKLTTALAPAKGVNGHVSTVGDETTPREPDGSPTYEPAWAHMAFPDAAGE